MKKHKRSKLMSNISSPGIMSLIDFYGDMERVKDPAGDRVKVSICIFKKRTH